MDEIFIVSLDTNHIRTLQRRLSSFRLSTAQTLMDVPPVAPATDDMRLIVLDADTLPDWETMSHQLQQAEDTPPLLALAVTEMTDDLFARMQAANIHDYIDLSAPAAATVHRVQQMFEGQRLRKQNAHLDAFAGTVAHDLQNPLATIMGYASTLNSYYSRLSEEDMRECVNQIIDCTDQMSDTIESMLTLARIDSDVELDLAPIQMHGVIEQVILRTGKLIQERHARLKLPDDWHPVVGYEPWVIEVMANYVSNAIKYGGTPPVVEVGSDVLPDGTVRVWVKDNGAGISEEDQRRIFSPFERVSSKGSSGTGLGLAIVQRIVTRLGGTVSVSSSPQGSIFAFTLPAPPLSQLQAPYPQQAAT